MTNALLPAFGGPAGRHARETGVFFRPLPWALGLAWLLFTVLYLRHLPCITTDPGNVINTYIRACYSDITANYPFRQWATDVRLLGDPTLDFPPLLAMFITIGGWLGRVLGWSRGAPAHDYDGLPAFFGATAILLFAAFLVVVIAPAAIARREQRPWEVLYIAASPAVFAAGLTSWDLFPLALTALGMWAVGARRGFEAGVLLGLALSASTMTLPFIVGVAAAFALKDEWRRLGWFVGTLVVTALAAHLPQLLTQPGSLVDFYVRETSTDVSYGSLWYLFLTAGVPLREFGSLTFVVTILLVGCMMAWLWVGGRQLPPGQMAAAVLLVVVLLAPAYPPQTGLWVVLAIFLARRVDAASWVYSAVLAAHYLAVWGRLGGHLSRDATGPWALYDLAVLTRMAFELAFLIEILRGAYTSSDTGTSTRKRTLSRRRRKRRTPSG